MDHKLLHRKIIRNYLNYFSEKHWSSILSYTLEYGIIMLLKKYNINELSPQLLSEILFQLKENDEDQELREKYQRDNNTDKNYIVKQNERFITSYNNNIIENNKKNLQDKVRSNSKKNITNNQKEVYDNIKPINISKESAFTTSTKKEQSFEVLQTSERPKKSEDKRRLIKDYEQKRREKIKANNSLSFAYSPVKKKTIYYTTEYNRNLSKKDKYSNIESRIKQEISKDKQNYRNKQLKEDEMYMIQNTDFNYKTTQDTYTQTKAVQNDNYDKNIINKPNDEDGSNCKSQHNSKNSKYVMIKDGLKNMFLVNKDFVYPIDEWKYGNQYKTENKSDNILYYNTSHSNTTPQWKPSEMNYLVNKNKSNSMASISDSSNILKGGRNLNYDCQQQISDLQKFQSNSIKSEKNSGKKEIKFNDNFTLQAHEPSEIIKENSDYYYNFNLNNNYPSPLIKNNVLEDRNIVMNEEFGFGYESNKEHPYSRKITSQRKFDS